MSSVRIIYTDPNDIITAVSLFAEKVKTEHPEVVTLYWYGSWVNGDFTPASDVDICIIVTHSNLAHRDRIPGFLPTVFPTGMDLLIYTENEFELLKQEHPSWYKIITQGKRVI